MDEGESEASDGGGMDAAPCLPQPFRWGKPCVASVVVMYDDYARSYDVKNGTCPGEDEPTRLAPKVQVVHQVDRILILIGGWLFATGFSATAGVPQGKLYLEVVPVARALLAQPF